MKPGSGVSSAAEAETDPAGQAEAAVRRPELITRLTRRRAASGLSQAGMARLMGTSQPAVARFESGRHDAQLSTVRRYAGALGLSLDLVEGEASVDLPPLPTPTPADSGTNDWPGQWPEADAPEVVAEEPRRPKPGHVLTRRQQKMLQVIRDSVQHRGYPPSLREIGEAVGLASASSVSYQLSALQRQGYLRREAGRARTVGVRPLGEPIAPTDGRIGADTATGTSPLETAYVPVMGRMATGGLALADEGIEDFFALPRQVVGEGNLFLLQVAGDCMSTHIEHGDWVAVRPQRDADDGDVVAAMFDGAAVVRVFRPSGTKVWLTAYNSTYPPIDIEEASILGRVVALLRQT